MNYTLFGNNDKKKGIKSPKNTLNDLTGKEWIFRTNSIDIFKSSNEDIELIKFILEIFESRYSTKGSESYAHHIRKIHPTPKPPQLMKFLIEFFSKENDLVYDPFMGVGGTLLGASLCNRKAIGIDLSEEYIEVYKNVCDFLKLEKQTTILGNSKDLNKITKLKELQFDLIMTDPPYFNMMAKKKSGESAKKKKDISPTPFTNNNEDIGNLPLKIFLDKLKSIINIGFRKLRNKRYVVLFTKDFQPSKEYHGMLHYDIITKLLEIEGLIYKGFKIWYDKSVNLYPYGYPYAYVGNQLHQYIIIFRKEIKE